MTGGSVKRGRVDGTRMFGVDCVPEIVGVRSPGRNLITGDTHDVFGIYSPLLSLISPRPRYGLMESTSCLLKFLVIPKCLDASPEAYGAVTV